MQAWGNLLNRRGFLTRTGLALGAGIIAASTARARRPIPAQAASELSTWEGVRAQFSLRTDLIHMAMLLIASHPRPVREAIERHRRGFDEEPSGYLARELEFEADVLSSAASYLGTASDEIALTDSTTMGLGLLYSGMKLRPGQEILTTAHDHYSTATSLRLQAERTGATVRRIALYDQPEEASEAEIIKRLRAALRPQTRIVAVTWVHSSTGVKLPIRAMADLLEQVNQNRDEGDRALLCVDGVHGFGIEDVTLPELGCDFFVSGTHKWLFGPRGTGLVWGRASAWPIARATIPTFDIRAILEWMGFDSVQGTGLESILGEDGMMGLERFLGDGGMSPPSSAQMTPGGFHSFENRWALSEAFRFHEAIGKARVQKRIHALCQQLKEGLVSLPRVRLRTPRSAELSAGIVCFEVDGKEPFQFVESLRARGVVGSVTPYATQYPRLAPSLVTSTEQVDETLRILRDLV